MRKHSIALFTVYMNNCIAKRAEKSIPYTNSFPKWELQVGGAAAEKRKKTTTETNAKLNVEKKHAN